jgi:predicted dehydrogenase
MSKSEQLRVGVIGGRRGSGHMAAIQASGGRMILAGVYDPLASVSKDFLEHHGGGKEYGSFEAAVEDCNLLIVASPQQYHAPQAAYALRAGVHVLSEVPAAVSMEQVSLLLAATRESSAQYMIAENYCYSRLNLIVAAIARSGALGEMYFGESEYLHEMKSWHHEPGTGERTWRYYWQVGKNGITYPTHSLGPLLQWMDDRIISISCIGTGRWTKPEYEMEDTVTLSARTRKGALLRMRLDLVSNRPDVWNYYSLQGTKGAYESGRLFGDKPRIYLEGISKRETWQELEEYADEFLPKRYSVPPAGADHWGSDAWPLLDFVDAIDTGSKPPLDVYKALEMTLPGLVSEQSIAQNGAWIAVPDPHTMTAGIGVNPGKEQPLT